MSLKTHVNIHPSTGHTKKDIPHSPNINPPLSCNEGKPLKMCFLHEPTCRLKPFKSSISETNSAYPARKEMKEESQGRDTFDFPCLLLDPSCSRSSGRDSKILTLQLLLFMKDFFFFFLFPHCTERP